MIYFAQLGDGGPIKIGYVGGPNELRLRIPTLEHKYRVTVNLLRTAEGDKRTERALHRRFDDLALGGELFTPAADLCALTGGDCPYDVDFARQGGQDAVVPMARYSNMHPAQIAELTGCRQSHVEFLNNGWSPPAGWHPPTRKAKPGRGSDPDSPQVK